MKKITSLFLAGAMTISSFAMTAMANENLGVFTYEEIIAPQYEDARGFSYGLSAVKKDGKWGYVNTDNEVVVPCIYDYAGTFNEGVGLVVSVEYVKAESPSIYGGYYDRPVYTVGIVDTKGNYTEIWYEIDGGKYQLQVETYFSDEIDRFFHNGYLSCGYATIVDEDGTTSDWIPLIINSNGEVLRTFNGGYLVGTYNEGYAVVTLEGMDYTLVGSDFEEIYSIMDAVRDTGYYFGGTYSVNQGLLPIWAYDEEWNEYLGFWDVVGKKWLIEPTYNSTWYSGINTNYEFFGKTGAAIVSVDGGQTFGMVDKTGKVVVPYSYELIMPYSEGQAVFQKNGKQGFMDDNQNVVVEPTFDRLTSLSGGLAVAVTGTEAYIIDRYGNKIEGSEKVDSSVYFREDGTVYSPSEYVVIEEDGLYGFGHITYLPELPKVEEMSSWAYEEVCKAIELELVPVSLQNMYTQDITRADFASVIVKALEEVTGQDIEDYVLAVTGQEVAMSGVFSDTNSRNVFAANALGIVNGTGNGNFSPYDKINREQAAAMLTRACAVLGEDTNSSETEVSDKDSISSWALDSIGYMNESGIMSSTGGNNFSPANSYTREQSYITIYRMFETVVKG